MWVKGLIVVAIPLAALIVTNLASLALQYKEGQVRAASVNAANLSNAADQVLADAVNAETGVRGYAATRDALFLAPYHLTLTRIGAERRSLRAAAIAEGDTRQQQVVDATAGQALLDLEQLRSEVAAGISVTDLRPALERAKTEMDLLRRLVAGLAKRPAALVAAQRERITWLVTMIDRLNVTGLVLGMLAGLVGVALFTSGISRRVTVAAANADRLGAARPLIPVPHSQDELGQLADSLVRAEQLLASRAAARDAALDATHAKNVFLSHTSHELRTPLNAILGFTQLLEMSDLSEEDRDSVQRILSAGRHLLALINEVIDIARIESGDVSLSIEPVAVLPLIEEVSHLMAPLATERSIEIVRHCPLRDLAVRASRDRFVQILVNLVSNAVKYNRSGGSVTITCQAAAPARPALSSPTPGRACAKRTSNAFSSPSSDSAPSEPGSRAPGSGCRWQSLSPRQWAAS